MQVLSTKTRRGADAVARKFKDFADFCEGTGSHWKVSPTWSDPEKIAELVLRTEKRLEVKYLLERYSAITKGQTAVSIAQIKATFAAIPMKEQGQKDFQGALVKYEKFLNEVVYPAYSQCAEVIDRITGSSSKAKATKAA